MNKTEFANPEQQANTEAKALGPMTPTVPPHHGNPVANDPRTKSSLKKISKSMRKLGMIGVSDSRLRALRELGVELDPVAMLRDGRAGAMVAQQAVLNVLLDLQRIYDKASDRGKVKLVPQIGYLARCLTTANKGIVQLVQPAAAPVMVMASKVVVRTMVPEHVVDLEELKNVTPAPVPKVE